MRHDEQVIIALGANVAGRYGPPRRALARAMEELCRRGLRLTAASGVWRGAPYGRLHQPPFFNALVVAAAAGWTPRTLLRLLTDIERRAGRRRGVSWGPRALDLDVIDFAGRVIRPVGMGRLGGSPARHVWQRRGLVLPHPDMARRAFVLAPLAEAAPHWRHPISARTAAQMLAALPPARRAACRREKLSRLRVCHGEGLTKGMKRDMD